MGGYTQTELDDIQAKWGLRFPPDLLALYGERRLVIEHDHERARSFDWITAPDAVIQAALAWPFEGFLQDVRRGAWWPEWGDPPADTDEREGRFRAAFAEAPRLVPLYGHRYLPQDPDEAGNPVFSVWRMDVIPYGANLAEYVEREDQLFDLPAVGCTKTIPFWSRAVEMNAAPFGDWRARTPQWSRAE